MNDKVYQMITERVIEPLQQGTVPWQKPWRGGEQSPRNLVSKKPYRGVNVFLRQPMAFESPHWLSFKQATELGRALRKSEHGCTVVFWRWLDGEEIDPKTGEPEKIPFLSYYTVFNARQCDGIGDHMPPTATTMDRCSISILRHKSGTSAMIPFQPDDELGRGLKVRRDLNPDDTPEDHVDPSCAAAVGDPAQPGAKACAAFRYLCRKVGMPSYKRFHAFRHAFVSLVANAGMNTGMATKITGHTDPRIFARYVHPDVSQARTILTAAREKLGYNGESPEPANLPLCGPHTNYLFLPGRIYIAKADRIKLPDGRPVTPRPDRRARHLTAGHLPAL